MNLQMKNANDNAHFDSNDDAIMCKCKVLHAVSLRVIYS